MTSRWLAASLPLALMWAACSEPADPSRAAPARMTLVAGDSQNTQVMQRTPNAVVVRVTDASGKPVPGVPVRFDLHVYNAAGDSRLVTELGSVRTDARGDAQLHATAGQYAARYTVTATLPDAPQVPAVRAIIRASAGPPARIEIGTDTLRALRVDQTRVISATIFDQFENQVPGALQLENLTPEVITLVGTRVTAIGFGIAQILVRAGQVERTVRFLVLRGPFGPSITIATAGDRHSCALTPAGKAYCWGAGPGVSWANPPCGGSMCTDTPVLVQHAPVFDTIAAGGDQTCGLSDGVAHCWGKGGAVPSGFSVLPWDVVSPVRFNAITVGKEHACGLTSAGGAYCWGANDTGALGTGWKFASATPVPAAWTLSFVLLAAGPYHTCGLTGDRAIWCWGSNQYGEITGGPDPAGYPNPRRVLLPAPATKVFAGGGAHTCAWAADGNTYCWGRNHQGQLGDGSRTNATAPRRAAVTIQSGATTESGSCGMMGNGSLWCWGLVSGLQMDQPRQLAAQGFSGISGGKQHFCATLAYCWGDNSVGAVGPGPRGQITSPVRVRLPPD